MPLDIRKTPADPDLLEASLGLLRTHCGLRARFKALTKV